MEDILTNKKKIEWVLFYAKWAIFSYHGENKLHFDEIMSAFVLDQHAELDFNSTTSLKQWYMPRVLHSVRIVNNDTCHRSYTICHRSYTLLELWTMIYATGYTLC